MIAVPRSVSAAIAATLLVGLTALSPTLAAQDRPRIWLGAGLGSSGSHAGAGGAALMGELVYQTGAHHFGVRALGVADIIGHGDSFGEVGVLYGRSAKRTWGHSAISAGLAWTHLDSCSDTGGGCSTVGVPVVGEVAARLFSIMGVGVQGFVNLNTKDVYRGFVLFIQLGWLP
jgi:hypothetical protein